MSGGPRAVVEKGAVGYWVRGVYWPPTWRLTERGARRSAESAVRRRRRSLHRAEERARRHPPQVFQ